MKKLILTAILSLFVLTSGAFANEEYKNMALNAVPFGFKLGETTCDEIGKRLPLIDGVKGFYGKRDVIQLYCGIYDIAFKDKLNMIKFYTNRSYKKFGLDKEMTINEIEKILLKYFNKDEIKKVTQKYSDSSTHFWYFYIKLDDELTLEIYKDDITLQIHSNEF